MKADSIEALLLISNLSAQDYATFLGIYLYKKDRIISRGQIHGSAMCHQNMMDLDNQTRKELKEYLKDFDSED